MARPLRVEFPGAAYHVTGRGNAGRRIYRDDGDRGRFLDLLHRVRRLRNWRCHAYCLMDNHYHLLVEIQEAGLAAGMQWLNGVYAQSFNRAGGRSGHLFQGRYHAALVQHEGHLLETARYIVLNPVRAQLCAEPRDWPWSSYRATAGEERPHPALTAGWLIEGFGGSSLASRTARYRSFIASGIRAT